jgi:hypothetical protein
MTSLPAAVVSISLGTINGIHMSGHKMILKSTRIGKGSAAGGLNAMNRRYPLANVHFAILGRKFRRGQH